MSKSFPCFKKYVIKFPPIIATIKVNQSVNNVLLTVAFLTYAATNETNKYESELVPRGKLNTTSLIIPLKKTKPYPKIEGSLKIQ